MRYYLFIIVTFLGFQIQAQQAEVVDFKTVNSQIMILPDSGKVSGKVKYTFEMLKDADSIYIDAIDMEFSDVILNNKKAEFYNDLKKIWFKSTLKKHETYSLTFKYVVYPKKAMYFVNHNKDWQIWTQGQGKYTSNWLPSIDDMNEKIEFDLSITNANDYQVLANGKLVNKEVGETTTTWYYDMQKPMSSYLVALAIGRYNNKKLTSKRGIPIELYYYPEDSAKVEPTYRYTKQMFDFLEKEIGIPYPWQNYKQVPVKDFLYSGMENTSLTIFSDDYMIDKTSFIDKNYVNVNAHELAHQWFGDLVTETEGKHHWLQEGFATYYALLAERDIFGDDYYYWRLIEYSSELQWQEEEQQATALLDPKASSTTFYKKGALVLHLLREEIGNKAFKKGIKNYLKTFKFKNVDTNDFITELEKTSGKNLNSFVKEWLLDSTLNVEKIYKSLSQNETLKKVIELSKVEDVSIDFETFKKETSSEFKCYLLERISQSKLIDNKDLFYNYALDSKDIKLRQTAAYMMFDYKLSDTLKKKYLTLLDDASYVTKEYALSKLWYDCEKETTTKNYYEYKRYKKAYLDKTKDVIGFNDKGFRQQWLSFSLMTTSDNQYANRKELLGYTDPSYNYQIRQIAFQRAASHSIVDEKYLLNLKQATMHHNWRFKSFAKKMMKSLSEESFYSELFIEMKDKL